LPPSPARAQRLVRRDRHTGFVARHHPGPNRFRRSRIQHRAGRRYGRLPAAGPFDASSPRPQQRRCRVRPHIAQRPGGPVDSALLSAFRRAAYRRSREGSDAQ